MTYNDGRHDHSGKGTTIAIVALAFMFTVGAALGAVAGWAAGVLWGR